MVAVAVTVFMAVVMAVTAAAAVTFGLLFDFVIGGDHAQLAEEIIEIDTEIPGTLFQCIILGDDPSDVFDAEAFEYFRSGGNLFHEFSEGHIFCNHK